MGSRGSTDHRLWRKMNYTHLTAYKNLIFHCLLTLLVSVSQQQAIADRGSGRGVTAYHTQKNT